MKPSDNVPGTKATWSEAITNFMQRTGEDAERAKQEKASQATTGLEEIFGKPPELTEAAPDPDFLPPLTLLKPPGGGMGPEEILAELDGMIGLAAVKAEVRETINMVRLGNGRGTERECPTMKRPIIWYSGATPAPARRRWRAWSGVFTRKWAS